MIRCDSIIVAHYEAVYKEGGVHPIIVGERAWRHRAPRSTAGWPRRAAAGDEGTTIAPCPEGREGDWESRRAILRAGAHLAGNEYSKYMNIHHDVKTLHRPSLPRRATDYFKFAFVRNPFDRLVSFYADKVRRPTQHKGRYYYDTAYNKLLARNLFDAAFAPDMAFPDFACLVARVPDWLADAQFKSQ